MMSPTANKAAGCRRRPQESSRQFPPIGAVEATAARAFARVGREDGAAHQPVSSKGSDQNAWNFAKYSRTESAALALERKLEQGSRHSVPP